MLPLQASHRRMVKGTVYQITKVFVKLIVKGRK
jgi:hypothetical protein